MKIFQEKQYLTQTIALLKKLLLLIRSHIRMSNVL